jgi:putative intracellular protease/amidase
MRPQQSDVAQLAVREGVGAGEPRACPATVAPRAERAVKEGDHRVSRSVAITAAPQSHGLGHRREARTGRNRPESAIVQHADAFRVPSRLGLSRRRPGDGDGGLYEVFTFVGIGWELLTGWPTGPRRFLPRIVAEDRALFRNLAGLPIAPDLTFVEAKRTDIVIVGDLAVGREEETRGRWPAAVEWLHQQQAQGALICSVCTGALMLAEAGLLDGEEATCHWAAVDQIKLRYPEVRLRPERVLVPAGVEHRLVTAGAAASWTDLALYLIARFCGEDEILR